MDVVPTTAKQKATSTALFVFAFVGFVASIIAVVSYFTPKDGGVLRIKITANDFQLPLEVAAPFTEDSPARRTLESMKSNFCERAVTTENQQPKTTAKEPSPATPDLCQQATDIEFLGQWANTFAEAPRTLYRYEIENRGSATAQQIRIAAKDVISLQLKRGDKFVDVQEGASEDYFSLPDLNPREKVEVLIWMAGGRYLILDEESAPTVTFSGASVSTEMYRTVPNGWWELYDQFGSMPTPILIFFVVAFSFLITMAIVLIAALIDALLKGKPLRSVFETPKTATENPRTE